MKLSKTQLHKIRQSGGFLDKHLGTLVKRGLPLIGNVLKPLTKRVLITLGVTAAASATDAAVHEKMVGSGFTNLIISNEQMKNIMRVVKSLQESGLLMKGISEKI